MFWIKLVQFRRQMGWSGYRPPVGVWRQVWYQETSTDHENDFCEQNFDPRPHLVPHIRQNPVAS